MSLLVRLDRRAELQRKAQYLQGVGYQGSWMNSIFGPVLESNWGAWQNNVVLAPTQTLLSFSAVFHCVTGISSDIAKMRVKLVRNEDGIWTEITENQPWLPLLRQPNLYQDRIKFFESWMLSKLMYGNTYVLKQRNDRRGIVTGLHVLHPTCVKPLVAEDGSVYYEIQEDYLAQTRLVEQLGIEGRLVIPLSEIIHDRMATLWHPLVGVSPLYACALAGTMGNAIQNNSAHFFSNRAMPGGVLEAPGAISDENAQALKAAWSTGFGGINSGKIAVLGDGLKFSPIMMTAEHAQTEQQFKASVEDVARAFRYPIWKLSGTTPPYTKPDQGQTLYYMDCLQDHIEDIELCLDHGLELPLGIGTEFDLDTLMRMDQQAQFDAINAMGDWAMIDEQRFRANYKKLPKGGNTVYRQEQDHAIEALYRRDQLPDPFGKLTEAEAAKTKPTSKPEVEEESAEPTRELLLDEDEQRAIWEADIRRDLIPA